ncbi:MAG: hypothetical protein ABI837_17655, partial [Acidobacteriota bacterium]
WYLLLLVLFLRECARAWRGPNRTFAEAGVVVAVGLAYAGLFEFNFGDTEVFWVMLDLFALVIASIEPPLPDSAWRGKAAARPVDGARAELLGESAGISPAISGRLWPAMARLAVGMTTTPRLVPADRVDS